MSRWDASADLGSDMVLLLSSPVHSAPMRAACRSSACGSASRARRSTRWQYSMPGRARTVPALDARRGPYVPANGAQRLPKLGSARECLDRGRLCQQNQT